MSTVAAEFGGGSADDLTPSTATRTCTTTQALPLENTHHQDAGIKARYCHPPIITAAVTPWPPRLGTAGRFPCHDVKLCATPSPCAPPNTVLYVLAAAYNGCCCCCCGQVSLQYYELSRCETRLIHNSPF